MESFFKNGGLFATLLLAGFVAIYFFSANAEEGSPEDLKWHICAEKEYLQWHDKEMEEKNADVCAFLGYENGPSCDEHIIGLHNIGMLNQAMQSFYREVVIFPKCGQHPE